jgi:multidrug efflux pump subunit AcrB
MTKSARFGKSFLPILHLFSWRKDVRISGFIRSLFFKRRDRVPTIIVRGDDIETTQPDVSSRIWAKLAPLRKALPENYRVEIAGSIEEAKKANSALAPLFPIMLPLMLTVIIIQVRSFSAMGLVTLTGPLGLIGAVPALLIFQQPLPFSV